ncbi:MAG: TonB-dependent receptor [Proteobacteria bacterium]|nr:TonB-dependent receptor [Pseudomonadota bacterium]
MPNKLIYTWFWSLLILVLLCPVQARSGSQMPEFDEIGMEELYGDEEFVSIATGSTKPVYKAPAVASVITAKQIKAMGARNLNEVLETVPGLHVGISAINRLDSVFSIRGIHTGFNPQVLILFNGIPFAPPSTGSHPTLFRMPVSSISRVEVIRGPGSAIYGADAYAGIVNIITKDASEIDTEIGGRIGSFNSKDAWLLHKQSFAGWDIGFSFEWQASKGDNDRIISSDFQTGLDPNFSLAPGPLSTDYDVFSTLLDLNKDNFRFRFWNWRLVDAGVGAGGSLALDPNGTQNEDLYLIDFTYSNDSAIDEWKLIANLNYIYHKSDSYFVLLPPGAMGFADGMIGNPSGVGQQTGIDLSAIYFGHVKHRIRIGLGARYQEQDTSEIKNFGNGVVPGVLTDVSNTPFVSMPDTSRNLWFVSLQDEWQFAPDWEITSGIRYDHYSDFGSTLNPRVALVWSTQHNLTTKLLYGRAFRAPSFQEQFADQNPVTLGNPGLDPETIDTVELAFDYRPTFDLQTTLNLFGYRANGLIEYVPSGGGTRTAQNDRDQKGYGFELEAKWKATNTIEITGNYAWQYSVDRETEARIPDAPSQQAFLNMNWKFFPKWSLYSQVNWVGNRYRMASDARAEIDDYVLVDMTLHRQKIMNHLDLTVAARNIFDEEAREPSDGIKITDDYPLEGRSLWCELRYRF